MKTFAIKKDPRNDMILFRFNHDEYNQIIEDLTNELEVFHKNEILFVENLTRNYENIQPAIDLLERQSVIESDRLNSIFNNPDYKII